MSNFPKKPAKSSVREGRTSRSDARDWTDAPVEPLTGEYVKDGDWQPRSRRPFAPPDQDIDVNDQE